MSSIAAEERRKPLQRRRMLLAAVLLGLAVVFEGSALIGAFAVAKDPIVRCMETTDPRARAMLEHEPEGTRIGSEFSTWPLGSRCTFASSDGAQRYIAAPDWRLSALEVVAAGLAVATVVAATEAAIHRRTQTSSHQERL
jgi:hypothetical protein